VRILTYNIHKGFSTGNLRFVLRQIREALVATEADLVLLQELQGQHRRHEQNIDSWPGASQLEFLADSVWPHTAYGKNAIYDDGHHGNAILSKYPFSNWENINVSPYRFASRSMLHGEIRAPGIDGTVHILCIHFGLLGAERHRQIAALCERIDLRVPGDAPLIVAGDFNDWTGRAERHFHSDLGLKEIFRTIHGRHARTFPAWWPFLPMDRIYYRGLQAVDCQRLGHMPWRNMSDHAPLLATFSP